MPLHDAPSHSTRVDQHQWTDTASGMRMCKLTDVRTSFSDYSQDSWDALSPTDREWWADTLADIHAARVELAELESERREAAQAIIDDQQCDDLENVAGVIRRAIAESAQS